MQLSVNGKDYIVKFHHASMPFDTNEQSYKTFPITNGSTIGSLCQIIEGEKIVEQGEARCSLKDQFCRAIGRKIALTRAIRQLYPGEKNKKSRADFWSAYWRERERVTKKKFAA